MEGFAGFGSPLVLAGIVLLAVVAIALAFRRRARARAVRPLPPLPEPSPAPAEVAFLDSSHIIEGPIIGRATNGEPPAEPGRKQAR